VKQSHNQWPPLRRKRTMRAIDWSALLGSGFSFSKKPNILIRATGPQRKRPGRRYDVNLFLTIKIEPQIAAVRASVRIWSRPCPDACFLSFILGRRAVLAGALWSSGMSRRVVQAEANLLSAFALTIAGTLGVGLPMTLVIIWICS
jgi:hypothetical protein